MSLRPLKLDAVHLMPHHMSEALPQQRSSIQDLRKSESTNSNKHNILKIYKSSQMTHLPKPEASKSRGRKLVATSTSLSMGTQNSYNQPHETRFSYDTLKIQDAKQFNTITLQNAYPLQQSKILKTNLNSRQPIRMAVNRSQDPIQQLVNNQKANRSLKQLHQSIVKSNIKVTQPFPITEVKQKLVSKRSATGGTVDEKTKPDGEYGQSFPLVKSSHVSRNRSIDVQDSAEKQQDQVETLIQQQDIFGALQIVHPKLCDLFRQHTNMLQRKIDTHELKAASAPDPRVATLERVNKEMKKQLNCYKEEIEMFQKTDQTYQELENYQKLITDFNSLFDHYSVLKQTNKKLNASLQEATIRERTFLSLLKNTEQYKAQAELLEAEYDRIYTKEGVKRENKHVEVAPGQTIPQLDLSIIYFQQQEENCEPPPLKVVNSA